MKKLLVMSTALVLSNTQIHAAAFDGFYAGLNAGLGGFKIKIKGDENQSINKSSLTVGIQTGYAATFSNQMFAAGELSVNYDGMIKKKDKQSGASFSKVFNAALALKGGYNFGSGIAYLGGFGGLSSYKLKTSDGAIKPYFFAYGPLVGAEFKITESWTAGIEGRFGFAANTKKLGDGDKVKMNEYAVLARLNYAF